LCSARAKPTPRAGITLPGPCFQPFRGWGADAVIEAWHAGTDCFVRKFGQEALDKMAEKYTGFCNRRYRGNGIFIGPSRV